MFTSRLGTVDAVLGSTLVLANGVSLLGPGEHSASSIIALTQTPLTSLIFSNAVSTIGLTHSVTAAEITKAAESILTITQVSTADNIISASSTINLTQSETVSGPRQGPGSNTLTISDEATVSFGALARVATSDIDLDTTNPNGGIADSSIRDLFVESPDLASDPLDSYPNFTDAWLDVARIADTFEESLTSTIVVSQDLPQPTGKRSVFAETTIVFVDDADTIAKQRSTNNTIIVSQTATFFKQHNAISNIIITDTAINGAVSLLANNTITFTQSSRPGPINRDSETIIVIADSARSSLKSLDASSEILVSQSENVIRPHYADTESKISGISDDIFIPPIGPVIPGVPFGMTQEVGLTINPVRGPESLIQIADLADVTHILWNAIDLTASSSIGFVQKANLSEASDADSTLAMSVSTDVVLNSEDAFNILIPTQLATYSIKRSSVATNSQLVVRQSAAYSIIRDTTECFYTPFVGASDSGVSPPRTTLPEAKDPPLDPSIRFRLVYPPFGAGDPVDTVDLRAPTFGNRERLSATRIQRETMGGTLTIYADPIWPRIHTLQLQFNALKTVQARQVLDFIDRWLGLEIGIYDYEARCWKGIITNPDEAVIQNGIESYSATLEIEAERIFAGIGDLLATSGVSFSQVTEGVLTTFPGDSAIDLNGSADYTKVPVGSGSESIPLSHFASRNNFFYESAGSSISLGSTGAVPVFSDFGNLIHDWDAENTAGTTGSSLSSWGDLGSDPIGLSATSGQEPTVRDAILGGRRVVEFRHSGSVEKMMSDSTLSLFDMTNKVGTIFIVNIVREVLAGGEEFVIGNNTDKIFYGGSTSTTRPVALLSAEGIKALETPTSVLANASSQLLTIRRNNNNVTFRRNGVAEDGATYISNPTPALDTLVVGGFTAGSNSVDQDIAQVLIYDDILSDADILTIEGLLTAKWGL